MCQFAYINYICLRQNCNKIIRKSSSAHPIKHCGHAKRHGLPPEKCDRRDFYPKTVDQNTKSLCERCHDLPPVYIQRGPPPPGYAQFPSTLPYDEHQLRELAEHERGLRNLVPSDRRVSLSGDDIDPTDEEAVRRARYAMYGCLPPCRPDCICNSNSTVARDEAVRQAVRRARYGCSPPCRRDCICKRSSPVARDPRSR